MRILKKNIWLIFYVLTLFFLLLFSILCYSSWKNIYNEYKTTQENMVKLILNNTNSLYKTQETILNILGNRFLEDTSYKDNPKAITTLSATLKDNPSIEAIALATPQGKMTFATGGHDVSKFPNLLKQEQSRDSFLETIQSTHMVFGRTYYFAPIKQWIIPIRKAIRNEKGDIVTVITAALRVNDVFKTDDFNVNSANNYYISIVREVDFYFQYNNKGDNYDKYMVPISNKIRKDISQAIFNSHKITREELRQNGSLVSFVHMGYTMKYLASLQYDAQYKLWVSVRVPYSLIQNEFLKKAGIYLSIFIFIEIIFFLLFKFIAKEEAKRSKELVFQATHDALTALPNRIYLQRNIRNWIFKTAPSFSILYVDLDHFKNINDNFGHQCGDSLLVKFSQRLKSVVPENTIIIRHGGDEFVIFTPLTQDNDLLNLGDTIIETISKPYEINNVILNISASIGIAKYPDHGETLDRLLLAADIAMYESKKIKKYAKIFIDSMQESYITRLKIEQELKKALENDELYMVYQPQIDASGNIFGIEALVRWNNATLGIIPPDQFIPIAESSGEISKIGRFIIDYTLSEIKEVQKTLDNTFNTSINISVRQFMEVGFLEHLLNAIEFVEMNKVSITIEITENLLIEDIDYILQLLHEVKSNGIQISMDDFGTGYSSLNMLRRLPIDELKIDKSFVDNIVEDIAVQKMVQNIIAIGKNLNMNILAEGVETKEQKTLLSSFGCDRFQGYYFAKPLQKADLITFFQEHDVKKFRP